MAGQTKLNTIRKTSAYLMTLGLELNMGIIDKVSREELAELASANRYAADALRKVVARNQQEQQDAEADHADQA